MSNGNAIIFSQKCANKCAQHDKTSGRVDLRNDRSSCLKRIYGRNYGISSIPPFFLKNLRLYGKVIPADVFPSFSARLCNVIAVQNAVQIAHPPDPRHACDRNLDIYKELRPHTNCTFAAQKRNSAIDSGRNSNCVARPLS